VKWIKFMLAVTQLVDWLYQRKYRHIISYSLMVLRKPQEMETLFFKMRLCSVRNVVN